MTLENIKIIFSHKYKFFDFLYLSKKEEIRFLLIILRFVKKRLVTLFKKHHQHCTLPAPPQNAPTPASVFCSFFFKAPSKSPPPVPTFLLPPDWPYDRPAKKPKKNPKNTKKKPKKKNKKKPKGNQKKKPKSPDEKNKNIPKVQVAARRSGNGLDLDKELARNRRRRKRGRKKKKRGKKGVLNWLKETFVPGRKKHLPRPRPRPPPLPRHQHHPDKLSAFLTPPDIPFRPPPPSHWQQDPNLHHVLPILRHPPPLDFYDEEPFPYQPVFEEATPEDDGVFLDYLDLSGEDYLDLDLGGQSYFEAEEFLSQEDDSTEDDDSALEESPLDFEIFLDNEDHDLDSSEFVTLEDTLPFIDIPRIVETNRISKRKAIVVNSKGQSGHSDEQMEEEEEEKEDLPTLYRSSLGPSQEEEEEQRRTFRLKKKKKRIPRRNPNNNSFNNNLRRPTRAPRLTPPTLMTPARSRIPSGVRINIINGVGTTSQGGGGSRGNNNSSNNNRNNSNNRGNNRNRGGSNNRGGGSNNSNRGSRNLGNSSNNSSNRGSSRNRGSINYRNRGNSSGNYRNRSNNNNSNRGSNNRNIVSNCVSVGVYSTMAGMDEWCRNNCNHSPRFCPESHCQCS